MAQSRAAFIWHVFICPNAIYMQHKHPSGTGPEANQQVRTAATLPHPALKRLIVERLHAGFIEGVHHFWHRPRQARC